MSPEEEDGKMHAGEKPDVSSEDAGKMHAVCWREAWMPPGEDARDARCWREALMSPEEDDGKMHVVDETHQCLM